MTAEPNSPLPERLRARVSTFLDGKETAELLVEAADEIERLREGLLALGATFEETICGNDPEVPCEYAADELEWPDDWCLPCYLKRTVREALASPEGGEERG